MQAFVSQCSYLAICTGGTLIVNILTRLGIVRPWNVVWNGTPGGLRESTWLLGSHIDPDVVYQAKTSLTLQKSERGSARCY